MDDGLSDKERTVAAHAAARRAFIESALPALMAGEVKDVPSELIHNRITFSPDGPGNLAAAAVRAVLAAEALWAAWEKRR